MRRAYLAATVVIIAGAAAAYSALPASVAQDAPEPPGAPAVTASSGDPAAPPGSDTLEDGLRLSARRIDLPPSEGYSRIRDGLVEAGVLAYGSGLFTPEVMKEEHSKIMAVLPGAVMEIDTAIHEKYAEHSAGKLSDSLLESYISVGISKLEFLHRVFNTLKQPGVLESPTKMMQDHMEMTVEGHGSFRDKLGNVTDADRERVSQVRWAGSVLNYFIVKEVRAQNNGETVPPAAWKERHEQYTTYVAEEVGRWNEKMSDEIDEYNDGEHSRYRIGASTVMRHMEGVYEASAAAAVPEHAAPSWERFRDATGQLIERNREIDRWIRGGNETALAHAGEITRELARGGYDKYWSMPLPIPKHPVGEPHMVGHDTVIHWLDGSHSTHHELCERCYDKASVVAVRGLNITWSNDTPVMHGLAMGMPPDGNGALFTGVIEPGETYSLDTSGLDAGHYGYYCLWHPWETGSFEIREP